MTITIRDVAEKAGVAPSTVSRVIADSPSISEKTKKKVRQVMQALHYIPNTSAQNLARSHSQTIGIVLPKDSDAFYQNPFFPTVLRGINDEAAKHDYSILLSTGNTNEDRMQHVQQMVLGHQVEGLIFLYALQEDPLIDFALANHFPMIVIGSPDNIHVNSVDNYNEEIAREATEHLINQGCQHLLWVGGDPTQRFIQLREQGFREVLTKYQLEITEDQLINDVEFLPYEGYQLAKRLTETNAPFDGIVVADQLIARGIREYFAYHPTLTAPKLITFKSYQQERHGNPLRESYINLKSQKLGSHSVSLLFDIMRLNQPDNEEERIIHDYIKSSLITEEETASAETMNPDL
ncbi:MAG: LacI family DNA-binding transcriptional regulator [Aerococcus sp.]|nr:LacI family DNA-binding transcriptional regulator [Aerococcus sp.]